MFATLSYNNYNISYLHPELTAIWFFVSEPPSCPTPASPPSPSRPPSVKVTSKSKKDKEPNQKKKKGGKKEQDERNSKMATGTGEGALRELSHPSINEQLKNHNAVTFKLVRTGRNMSLSIFHVALQVIWCTLSLEANKANRIEYNRYYLLVS